MGSSYSSLTLRGPARDRLLRVLEARGREAFVGPTENGCTVVFDEESENDPAAVARLAEALTRELGGAALGVTVHDEDIVFYSLVRDGTVLDEYHSCPGYFEGGDAPPTGGDAALLCEAFGAPGKAAEVERILRAPAKRDPYFFETARHGDLAEALGLPEHSVNLGYKYVYQGEAEELEGELAHVGEADTEDRDVNALVRRRLERAGIEMDFGAGPMPGVGLDPDLMAQMQAAAQSMVASMRHPAHGYFQALAEGDAETIRSFFLGDVVLDDPLSGRVEGDEALAAHVAVARELLGARMMTYAPNRVIETEERLVAEGMVMLGPFPNLTSLPAAVVWERAPEGGYAAARAYYSLEVLTGADRPRPPILSPDPAAPLPESVAAHLRALAGGDAQGVVATFGEGCLDRMLLVGSPLEAARAQYGARLGAEGPVALEACTVAGDGANCAVEFVATRWDGAEIEPQAGLLVLEMSGGKPCAVRLYGDLGPAPVGFGPGGFTGVPGFPAGGMPDLSGLLGGMAGAMGGGGFPDLSALFGGGFPGMEDDEDDGDEEGDEADPHP
jgi:SnoaL-like protein